jgi:hypothetical protein
MSGRPHGAGFGGLGLAMQLKHRGRDDFERDHPLGCKRLLVSSDWYPALTRRTWRSWPTALLASRRAAS